MKKSIQMLIVGIFLLLVIGTITATTIEGDYNTWEGGTVKSCCQRGYCYTLVNAECSDELWNKAICGKYGICKNGIEELKDVEGVKIEE